MVKKASHVALSDVVEYFFNFLFARHCEKKTVHRGLDLLFGL